VGFCVWGCDYGQGAAEGGFDFGVEVVAEREEGRVSWFLVWVRERGWGDWLRKGGIMGLKKEGKGLDGMDG